MSTYQLYEILKSVNGVSEEQAREAIDSITYAEDVATKDNIRDIESRMATKADLKDIESRMATKDDIKDMATKADLRDIESRMATKADLKDMESRMVTKEYLEAELSKLESKMLKQQLIHSGIVISAIGLIIVISKFVS